MKLIGLDLGTTTTCGLVLDPGSGAIVEVVTEPNKAAMRGRAAWEALQDPDAILAQAKRIACSFLERHGDVGGVGVTGQMHGILYVDRNGRAVSPLVTWQDERGEQLDDTGVTCSSRVSAAMGRPTSTGMGSVTHYYDMQAGLVPEDARALCTIMDYVAMGLSRTPRPVMDATNAASLGCFDLRALRFRGDVLESIGIDPALFPSIATTYPALGEVLPGIPVFVAVGDNQAGFLGSVPDAHASLLANVGTGSQLSVSLDECVDIPGIDTRPFPFGGYIAVGAAICGGRAYALLRDFFARTLRMFTGRDNAPDWAVMNAVEQSYPINERLLVDTRFAGTRTDPKIRGGIGNISLENFTPENLVRGVREGIASELFDFYGCFPKSIRGSPLHFAGSGNGIRENPALRYAIEERFGMHMLIPEHREEASLGAALLAGIASGVLPGVAAAGALVRHEMA